MEKTTKWIVGLVAALLCVAAALTVSFVKISDLNETIMVLMEEHRTLLESNNDLHNELGLLESDIREQLKKEASLLAELEYTVGKPSEDMKSAPVAVTVTPKTVTEDMEIFLTFEDTTVPMTRTGKQFSGSVEVGLFADYEEQLILTMESSAGTQTEALEDVYVCQLYTEYLPWVNVSGYSSSTEGTGAATVDFEFTNGISGDAREKIAEFRKVSLIRWKNGQQILNQDITEGLRTAAPAYIASYSINSGEQIEQEIVAEDTMGYIHKIQTTSYFASDSDEGLMIDYSDEQIYDRDGDLLYGVPSPWER